MHSFNVSYLNLFQMVLHNLVLNSKKSFFNNINVECYLKVRSVRFIYLDPVPNAVAKFWPICDM